MSIKITDQDNKIYDIEVISFSDGCYNVKVPDVEPKVISVFIENAIKDLHLLDLVISAYNEMGFNKFKHLFIPYLPNARADRVFNKGNAFPLGITLNGSWLQSFNSISVYDLHSEVSEDLLPNNVAVVSQQTLVKNHCRVFYEGYF